MNHPVFEEKSLAAISFNRAVQNMGRVMMRARRRAGRRTEEWVDYRTDQVFDEVYRLGTAWRALGVAPGKKVAVMGHNRPRWVTTAASLFTANVTMVTVYPTLTAEEAAFVLGDSGAVYVVVDTKENAEKILSKFDELPDLEKVWVMDPLADSDDTRLGSYMELMNVTGNRLEWETIYQWIREIEGRDTAALIYTSGTTGRPKGVMLTNDNLLSQRIVPPLFGLNASDVFLNHLPFCHSFGLSADMLGTADVGAQLVIADGMKPEQIRHGLRSIRPTVLMSVPRLYEKLFIEVRRVVANKPKRIQTLFDSALSIGKEVFDLKNEGKRVSFKLAAKYTLSKKILSKVRKEAGLDRLRIAYAGGGPTSRELCYFFQSLGIDIYQGYGLTETSPVCNVNLPGKNKLGTVGPAIEGVDEKIAGDGEILVRGPNVMRGYHGLESDTKEAIDEEGWFHTGDIGEFDSDGYLKITDRKKELIITSAGKNIAPLAIESAFNTEIYMEQVTVIGDGRKYLSALICPNFALLKEWAKKKGLRFSTEDELLKLPEVRQQMQDRVDAVNRKFARFEQIKKFTLMDHEFSEETGELTPTQKIKRRVVNEIYADAINEMYPKEETV